jgi:predicted DNA-binding protein (UPF0251 family)
VGNKRGAMVKDTEKKEFTITEAAKKLGVSRQAVHVAIKKGSLKARAKKVAEVVWYITSGSLESYRVSGLHQAAGKKIINV